MRLSQWIHPEGTISRMYVNELVTTECTIYFQRDGNSATFHASGNYSVLAKSPEELEKIVSKRMRLDHSPTWSDLVSYFDAQVPKWGNKKGGKASKPTAKVTIKDAAGTLLEYTQKGNTITVKGIVHPI